MNKVCTTPSKCKVLLPTSDDTKGGKHYKCGKGRIQPKLTW